MPRLTPWRAKCTIILMTAVGLGPVTGCGASTGSVFACSSALDCAADEVCCEVDVETCDNSCDGVSISGSSAP